MPARITATPSWAWLGWYNFLWGEGGLEMLEEPTLLPACFISTEVEVWGRVAHLYPCSSLWA